METFEREAYEKLASWKDSSQGSTALLIEGAWRVGKSTIAEEFGRRNYASYMLVDFSKAPDDVLGYFVDLRNDLDAFFMYLSSFYGVELHRRDSLIIFDEVQLYPKAREAIKQLVADGRYDYIETGSLVSIRENVKDILIPSEEESIRLNPMDFDEFLWALGEKPLSALIADSFKKRRPLPDSLHRKAMRLFREYMLVGGMPQAVSKYVETHDFSKVDNVKRNILRLYRQDISKHGGSDRIRITRIFDNLVGQLSKKEKKFNITSLGEKAKTRDYEDAFFWLSDAFITNDCFNSTDPSVGLSISEDHSTVKCYAGRYRASHYARPGRLGTDRKQPVPGHPPRTHRDQRGHARGERRCTASPGQRAPAVLLFAQRSRRPVEPHGDRLPHRRTVRERGNEVQGQPHRGQVIETLPHGLVRQIQGKIR